MSDQNIQLTAEVTVLYYKLDKIRNHIRARKEAEVDSVVSAELNFILNMIESYEEVPSGWKLSEPIVPLNNQPEEVN